MQIFSFLTPLSIGRGAVPSLFFGFYLKYPEAEISVQKPPMDERVKNSITEWFLGFAWALLVLPIRIRFFLKPILDPFIAQNQKMCQ